MKPYQMQAQHLESLLKLKIFICIICNLASPDRKTAGQQVSSDFWPYENGCVESRGEKSKLTLLQVWAAAWNTLLYLLQISHTKDDMILFSSLPREAVLSRKAEQETAVQQRPQMERVRGKGD